MPDDIVQLQWPRAGEVLAAIDDWDLDPYEFRLLLHYVRIGEGGCSESTRATAQKCHMSIGQVSGKRKSLARQGFLMLGTNPAGMTLVRLSHKWMIIT